MDTSICKILRIVRTSVDYANDIKYLVFARFDNKPIVKTGLKFILDSAVTEFDASENTKRKSTQPRPTPQATKPIEPKS